MKNTLDCTVTVAGSEKEYHIELPKTLTMAEILNYLEHSQKLQFEKKSFLLLQRSQIEYIIVGEKKLLTDYMSSNFRLIVYPPQIKFIKVHCPDKRINIRSFDSKEPASKMVDILCNDVFHLKHPEAYAIYQVNNPKGEAFSPNKSIIEYVPYIKDIYLLRRFWFSSCLNLDDENDIHFNYAQARQEFYLPTFSYKFVDYINLTALSIMVEFDGKKDEATKFVTKSSSSELKKYIPAYLAKEKKLSKQLAQALDKCPTNVVQAKMEFITKAMTWKYFSATIYPCNFTVDNKAYEGFIAFLEDDMRFLEDLNDYKTIYSIKYVYLRKFKLEINNTLKFTILNNGSYEDIVIFEIQSPRALQIQDYIVIFLNYLRQARTRAKEAEMEFKSHRHRANTVRTSLSGLVGTDLDIDKFKTSKQDMYQNKFAISLTRIDFVKPQQQITFSIPRCSRLYDNENEDSVSISVSKKMLLMDKIPKILVGTEDIGISKQLCHLLKRTISRDSLAPLTEADDIIAQLGGSQIASSIVHGCNGNFQRVVATISRVCTILASDTLKPLDAFSCLNYIRSYTLRFLSQQWADYDFLNNAKDIDPVFAAVAASIYKRRETMTPNLAYVLLGAYEGEKAEELHALSDAVMSALMGSCVALARGFLAAGLGNKALLEAVEKSTNICFDPLYASQLIEMLKPLVQEMGNVDVQKQFFGQDHNASVDMKLVNDIMDVMSHLTSFLSSPASLFLLSHSKRCFKPCEFPETMMESIDMYQGAMESSFAYYNADKRKNVELSQRIASSARTFFDLFCDNQLANARDTLDFLNKLLERGFSKGLSLDQFLDTSDSLHEVMINLIQNNHLDEAIPLLANDLTNEDKKYGIFNTASIKLDEAMRMVAKSPDKIDTNLIRTAFTLLSFGAILCTRDTDLAHEVKQKLVDIGNHLMDIVKAPPEQREQLSASVRNDLRSLRFYVNDPANCKEIIDIGTRGSISFALQKPDISTEINALKKICSDLSRFNAHRPASKLTRYNSATSSKELLLAK